MEYVAGEIDRVLVLTTLSATKRYRSRGTPGLGQLKISDVAMIFLKSRKACFQVSSHRKDSVFLSSL